MKRKIVITTEKREIWVIRQPSGEMKEHEIHSNEAESSVDSLIALLDQASEAHAPPDEQN